MASIPSVLKFGFVTPLLLLACQSEKKSEAKRLADNAASSHRANLAAEEARLLLIEKSGNAVLHYPVRQNSPKSLLKNKYGNVCFNIESLQYPWFLVDTERHGHRWYSWGWDASPSDEKRYDNAPELLIVAEASKIDIPFYEVQLSHPVDYEFVTPFQEYIYVWVTSVEPEFDEAEYFKRISFFNSRTQRVGSEFPPLFTKSEYNYIPYKEWSLTPFYSTLGGPKTNFLLLNEDQTVAVHSNRKLENLPKSSFINYQRPTSIAYRSPTIKGVFLHESKQVAVNFEASLLALPHSPRLLDTINNAVTSLISKCE